MRLGVCEQEAPFKERMPFPDEEGREGTANLHLSLAQTPGPGGASKAVRGQGKLTLVGTTF